MEIPLINRSNTSSQPAPQSPIEKEICEKITSIRAESIAAMSSAFAKIVLSRLGPKAKVETAKQVVQIKETQILKDSSLQNVLAPQPKAAEQFLDEHHSDMLFQELQTYFIGALTNIFSSESGAFFYRIGYTLCISDQEPYGGFSKIAEQAGVIITSRSVPPSYFILLQLDLEATQKKKDLVFTFFEKSERMRISSYTFSPSDFA